MSFVNSPAASMNCQREAWNISLPIIDEPVDPLLSQLPSVLMVIVVNSPAENHQSFRMSIPNVGKILQQLLRVSTDPLKQRPQELRSCLIWHFYF